jgi:hypothetical protein
MKLAISTKKLMNTAISLDQGKLKSVKFFIDEKKSTKNSQNS